MSKYYEMIRHSRRYNDQIKKFCAPLFNNFGFNSIFYHKITNEGYGICLGSHVESFEYYFENDLFKCNPYAKHPKFFETSVHLLPDVQKSDYQAALQVGANEFNVDYKIVILEKNDEGCHGFSFGVPAGSNKSLQLT